jgi:hypothetical protein
MLSKLVIEGLKTAKREVFQLKKPSQLPDNISKHTEILLLRYNNVITHQSYMSRKNDKLLLSLSAESKILLLLKFQCWLNKLICISFVSYMVELVMSKQRTIHSCTLRKTKKLLFSLFYECKAFKKAFIQ